MAEGGFEVFGPGEGLEGFGVGPGGVEGEEILEMGGGGVGVVGEDGGGGEQGGGVFELVFGEAGFSAFEEEGAGVVGVVGEQGDPAGTEGEGGVMAEATPFSPPSGLATGSFNGLHTKSKFLAAPTPVPPRKKNLWPPHCGFLRRIPSLPSARIHLWNRVEN